MNTFQSMSKQNWDRRFNKFNQSLISWSSRAFDSIFQRVDVINMFALTRIFYVAAVLPMTKPFINKVK